MFSFFLMDFLVSWMFYVLQLMPLLCQDEMHSIGPLIPLPYRSRRQFMNFILVRADFKCGVGRLWILGLSKTLSVCNFTLPSNIFLIQKNVFKFDVTGSRTCIECPQNMGCFLIMSPLPFISLMCLFIFTPDAYTDGVKFQLFTSRLLSFSDNLSEYYHILTDSLMEGFNWLILQISRRSMTCSMW